MDNVLIEAYWHWVKPLAEKMQDLHLFPELHSSWIDPEWLALFIDICKQWPDNDDDFPGGKWASIQALQGLHEQYIRIDLERAGVLQQQENLCTT